MNDKPIIFYTNPPYAASGNNVGKSSKNGVALNGVSKIMHSVGLGKPAENIYSAFFYKILMLKEKFNLHNVYISFFCKTQYMTGGPTFHSLKKAIFDKMNFYKGFLINSGEFSDTAKNWGISFTVLGDKESTLNLKVKPQRENLYPLDVLELQSTGITKLSEHTLTETNSRSYLSNWVKNNYRKDRNNDIHSEVLVVTSAFKAAKNTAKIYYPKNALGYAWFKGNLVQYSDYPKNALGYAWFKGNLVQYSERETGLFTTDYSRERGIPIIPENFEKCMINFAIRRATNHSWINDKDNYMKPSVDFINNKSAVADCIIYSLFDTYSYQVSLKNILFREKEYSIKNQFFWLSKYDIKTMADKYKYAEMGFQIDDADDRFVYNWLESHKNDISDEGKKVLFWSKQVVQDTFSLRKVLSEDYPEFCFMRWDAGWEQIRRLMNNSTKVESYTKGFVPAFLQLRKKINKYIYEYNFLNR